MVRDCVNKRYEKKLRKRLKNDQFSILCSTCIGGIMYHRLGKQFLSPTINMWMNQKEFLTFVEHLDEALDQELVFIQTKYDYPVAQLTTKGGTVNLYFNHAKTETDAKRDWTRRKERVNRDNLFIVMYDFDGITKADILRLDKIPCKNKIVLSPNKHDIPYVFTIRPKKMTNYLDKDRFGRRTFEKKFDFVDWLNV
jgi:uncharacterized protein (DUF1919 family)